MLNCSILNCFFYQFTFFLSIVFLNDIVGMAESPYPVVHVYTVHVILYMYYNDVNTKFLNI